jgi:hypothetical protein
MRGVSHSAIVAAGFRIGDHTITHPYLTRLSDAGGPRGWRAGPMPPSSAAEACRTRAPR